jgi:hypothetical protein
MHIDPNLQKRRSASTKARIVKGQSESKLLVPEDAPRRPRNGAIVNSQVESNSCPQGGVIDDYCMPGSTDEERGTQIQRRLL